MNRLSFSLILVLLASLATNAQRIQDPPFGRPDAVIDLASREGVQLVNGQWRYHDVKIVDADSRAVGPDLKPSGAPIRTYDYTPHAGTADFDDSQWEAVDATTLDRRRSTAKVCFNWYRINVTIPEKIANFSTAGSTIAFEIVIDDYAEIWVDGKLPRVLGQPGGPVIKGFNAPNRMGGFSQVGKQTWRGKRANQSGLVYRKPGSTGRSANPVPAGIRPLPEVGLKSGMGLALVNHSSVLERSGQLCSRTSETGLSPAPVPRNGQSG
jgi:hypothetical protein